MCMNNFLGMTRTKDLKIITSNPTKEVKDPKYVKEKIENKMALETSETSDTNARPSFKFPLPKPIYNQFTKKAMSKL